MIQLVRPTEEQKEQAVEFRQELIFLLSWQIQNGSITVLMIAGAVFFAQQSAVLSVLLPVLLGLLTAEAVVFLCWR